jgi:peptidoglycan DL-endopeptidase CwlO
VEFLLKKTITILGATILLGTAIAPSLPTYAETSTEIEQKIKTNQQEQSEVDKRIQQLEEAIKENEQTMIKTESDIQKTEEEIKNLQDEIKVITQEIEVRDELIKNRLRSMQSGNSLVDYLDVLLGSSDFEEFIGRASAIATITKADQDLIVQQQTAKKELQDKEATAEEKLASLNDLKVELEGMKSQIEEQKAQAVAMKEQLSSKEQQLLIEKEKARQEELAKQASQAVEQVTVASESSTKKASSSKSNSSSAPVVNGDAVRVVTSVGNRFIGNSVYSFGAADPANGRFDCSGFVSWVFQQAGISIGRSTSVQSTKGTKVSTSEMRSGDLVFFDTYKKNGHVGIYLGNGKFIGSQSSTGVAIADMTSGYWANHFKGHVRRIIN